MIIVAVGIIGTNLVKYPLTKEIKRRGESLATNLAANCAEQLLLDDELAIGVQVDKTMKESGIVQVMVLNKKVADAFNDAQVKSAKAQK